MDKVLFDSEIEEEPETLVKLDAWMRSERFSEVERPYNAEQVMRFRPVVPREYPAKHQSKKLYRLLRNLQAKKQVSFTFGALDPVQVVQMAPYLSSVYVSGWQCSSTASTSNEPGPDLADYPYDTVPNKVDQLFKAQEFHARKQRQERAIMTPEQRNKHVPIDYMRPIIADGDTGHGGLTAVMKLTKLFIEAGAAGVHFEDQKPGVKKCGHMGGKVLVSVQEHIDRLIAARLQADIMGVPLVIVSRTDAEAATLLDNNIDPRDHPFILGVTENGQLETYPDAVLKKLTNPRDIQNWKSKAYSVSNQEARKIAASMGVNIEWDWEKARVREGYYQVKGSVDYCVARGVAFAPYCDLLWMETSKPIFAEAKHFAEGVKAAFPNKMLAYNLSPSFNWDASGMSDHEISTYVDRLGQLGFVWQFITLAGFHGDGLFAETFARNYSKEKMLAYVRDIQRQERANNVSTLTHQKWSGANFVDALLQTVTGGKVSTLATSKGITEAQFESPARARL